MNIGNQSMAVRETIYKDPFLEFMSGWMKLRVGKRDWRLEFHSSAN